MFKLRKTYKFVDAPIGVKRTAFKNLRAGDIFYQEERSGTLVTNAQGEMLELAVSDAFPCKPAGNYGIEVKPI